MLELRRGHDELGVSVLEGICAQARGAVARQFGVAIADLLLVEAGTVGKTKSGKVKRRACRERYLNGQTCVLGVFGARDVTISLAVWNRSSRWQCCFSEFGRR